MDTNHRQLQSGLICLTKRRDNNEPSNFRPIALLNAEYKLLSRLFARLRPVLEEHLKTLYSVEYPENRYWTRQQ
jgi:hypothetical protein